MSRCVLRVTLTRTLLPNNTLWYFFLKPGAGGRSGFLKNVIKCLPTSSYFTTDLMFTMVSGKMSRTASGPLHICSFVYHLMRALGRALSHLDKNTILIHLKSLNRAHPIWPRPLYLNFNNRILYYIGNQKKVQDSYCCVGCWGSCNHLLWPPVLLTR